MTTIVIASIVAACQLATGTIHGVVLDTRGGVPLRRVSVRLQKTERVTVTGDDGRFEIDQVPAGDQELYVSAVDFILVKRAVSVRAGEASDVTIVMAEGTGTYTETVNVVGAAPARHEAAVAAEQSLRSTDLQQLGGAMVNDPMRAIQALPGVVAGDDFRSEFSIRGAGVQQMNFTFEGISTPFLLHTIQQVHDTGSIAMVYGEVLEETSPRADRIRSGMATGRAPRWISGCVKVHASACRRTSRPASSRRLPWPRGRSADRSAARGWRPAARAISVSWSAGCIRIRI